MQWEILRRASTGTTTLVLIGDPKQAIYAFRGADVFTYLEATGAAPDAPHARRATGAATSHCSTALGAVFRRRGAG